jgi:hypothetical protein
MSHPAAVIGAIHVAAGATPSTEDAADEYAPDGILVVQVCRFRTISGKIPEAATRVRRG